jgi:hypothetical protein
MSLESTSVPSISKRTAVMGIVIPSLRTGPSVLSR